MMHIQPRLAVCADARVFAVSQMLKLLALSNNDTAIIAQANSVHWAVNGFLQLFGTPIAGALSDSIGRKPLWALGRATKLIWFMGSMYATSMNGYIVACICAWGLGDMGTMSVQEAAWADVFGDRPELSARLKASNQIWTGIAGLVGPVIGAQMSTRSPILGFYVSSVMCVVEAFMVMGSQESLSVEERKPFAGFMPLLKRANPFSSIGLLFTNGPGLRSLGIAAGFLRSVVTVYSTIEPFRLGPLGWSPAEQSYYSAGLSGVNSATTAFVSKPLLKRWGNRKVFELGSLAAAISYIGLSQSCRPGDAGHLRKTIQFCVCKICLMTPWSEPAFASIGPMITKQGMAVTDAGRGELSAAYDGLASALGVFTPFLWANLYAFFQRLPKDSTMFRIFGPGGHFVVAAIFRLCGYIALRMCPAEYLFIEDTPSSAATAKAPPAEPEKKEEKAKEEEEEEEEDEEVVVDTRTAKRATSPRARQQKDTEGAASPKAVRLKSMLDPNMAAGFPRGLRQKEKQAKADAEAVQPAVDGQSAERPTAEQAAPKEEK